MVGTQTDYTVCSCVTLPRPLHRKNHMATPIPTHTTTPPASAMMSVMEFSGGGGIGGTAGGGGAGAAITCNVVDGAVTAVTVTSSAAVSELAVAVATVLLTALAFFILELTFLHVHHVELALFAELVVRQVL